MATLEMNVNQANSDFQSIKTAITDKGVAIDDGTKTSEYASKVEEVYEAGYEECNTILKRYIAGYFQGSTSTHFDIPYGTTRLRLGAFYYCSNLVTITIPDTVTTIQNGIFIGCTGLKEIYIPSSITQCGANTFMECTRLAKITYGVVPYNSIISASNYTNCTALTTIIFESGSFVKNADFTKAVKLSVESMKGIIERLTNFMGTDEEFAHTLKFTEGCWANLEADSTSPTGGTWADYVMSLGWNI